MMTMNILIFSRSQLYYVVNYGISYGTFVDTFTSSNMIPSISSLLRVILKLLSIEFYKILAAAAAAAAKSLQLCPTLCDPIDVSPV